MQDYQIIHTQKSDLPFIYSMFEDAIIYQKRNGFPVWPDYDKGVLDRDIEQKLQYKIVIDGQIACIFSTCFSDEIVWRERDQGDAIYLHRVVVNPSFKGQKQFAKVLEWSKNHAATKNLPFLRMDTWADNPSIIAYYQSFGFEVYGYFRNPDTEDLPIQQRGNLVVLLEYAL